MTTHTTPSARPSLAPPAPFSQAMARAWRTAQGRMRTSWQPASVWLGAPLNALQDPTVVPDAVVRFGEWCAVHPGELCEVGLSASWMLTCVVPPGWSLQAGQLHALNQWGHYHDLDAQALSAHWVVRHVADAQASVFCAAPRALMEGLQAQAKAHKVRLAWVGPWWVRGVQASLAGWSAPDATAATRTLSLHEPGLTLCVQAHAEPRGRWTLTQVQWRMLDAAPGSDDVQAVRVPLPAADAGDPMSTVVCDHPEVRGLLSGRSAAWRASP